MWDRMEIGPQHLHLSVGSPAAERAEDPWNLIDLTGGLEDVTSYAVVQVEKRKIRQALDDADSNIGVAAKILQLNPQALMEKTQEYEIKLG